MFIGHYGVAFAARRSDPRIPLWMLFLAVQWLDVLWAPLVLLGVEKVRIVPGITASNPLDLYYMPYTHSLVAAIGWSVVAALVYRASARDVSARSSVIVGAAVFSHWVLDLVVHRPDLPLYASEWKVGLGLWNRPALALGLECALLFGGIALAVGRGIRRPRAAVVFGITMLAIQCYVFFGPPPVSPSAAAMTALAAYMIFAGVIFWLEDRRNVDRI